MASSSSSSLRRRRRGGMICSRTRSVIVSERSGLIAEKTFPKWKHAKDLLTPIVEIYLFASKRDAFLRAGADSYAGVNSRKSIFTRQIARLFKDSLRAFVAVGFNFAQSVPPKHHGALSQTWALYTGPAASITPPHCRRMGTIYLPAARPVLALSGNELREKKKNRALRDGTHAGWRPALRFTADAAALASGRCGKPTGTQHT